MTMSVTKLSNNESLEDVYVYIADWEHANQVGTGNRVVIGEVPAGGFVKSVTLSKAEEVVADTCYLEADLNSSESFEFLLATDLVGMTTPVYNTGIAFEMNNAQGLALVSPTTTTTDITAMWSFTNFTAGKVVMTVTVFNPLKVLED